MRARNQKVNKDSRVLGMVRDVPFVLRAVSDVHRELAAKSISNFVNIVKQKICFRVLRLSIK